MVKEKIARSFGTHDGVFHADEVTACALLILFDRIDREKVIRTRCPEKLAECEYVCDVGGIYEPDQKLFDHHQVGYQGSLSSAGMILKYLNESGVISDQLYQFYRLTIVQGVDAHDNGQLEQTAGICTFSHLVADYVPIPYGASKKVENAAFQKALDFALEHLELQKNRNAYMHQSGEAVKKRMEGGDIALIFDESIPWLESFFEFGGKDHPALFVVMPSGEHWKLRGIPPTYEDRMAVRYPLPAEWAGLLEGEFEEKSGMSGAIFCHKQRFISVWETKEDALKALEYVLETMKGKQ